MEKLVNPDEKPMKEYVTEVINGYIDCVKNSYNEEEFLKNVAESFTMAKSLKHYVLLKPIDFGEYFTPKEQKSFSNEGYYVPSDEDRFNNKFFAPEETIETMIETLQDEDMCTERVGVNFFPGAVYVVTIYGVRNSNFYTDFAKQNENVK